MNAQDAAARVAVLTALRDAIADELTGAKDELSATLGALNKQHGTDRVTATLPGGEKVGSIAWVPASTRFRVCDAEAFAEWALENHPSEVRTVLMVRPVWQTVYLKDGLKAVGSSAVDRETGEIVPGVEAFSSSEYPRLSFARDGRGSIAAAWRAGTITTDFLALLPPVTEGEH